MMKNRHSFLLQALFIFMKSTILIIDKVFAFVNFFAEIFFASALGKGTLTGQSIFCQK